MVISNPILPNSNVMSFRVECVQHTKWRNLTVDKQRSLHSVFFEYSGRDDGDVRVFSGLDDCDEPSALLGEISWDLSEVSGVRRLVDDHKKPSALPGIFSWDLSEVSGIQTPRRRP
jgi:hypothetical protein